MIGSFDPGDDRDSQPLSVLPSLAVQDVLIQQGEERFHCAVSHVGAKCPHRTDEVVKVQGVHELQLPELAAVVRVHDASGGVAAPR